MAKQSSFYKDTVRPLRQYLSWKKRDFANQSPQFIKEKVFERNGIPGGTWVETGTFKGETTAFLSSLGGMVHTIEPAEKYYQRAKKKFSTNGLIAVHNGPSEEILPTLLPTLSGDINFWLDGHYSAGSTFKGNTDCPILAELKSIDINRANFKRVTVLIDDIRCFGTDDANYADYPSLDELVDWARDNNMTWKIEHDIFIASST
jgi:hypothetical protein